MDVKRTDVKRMDVTEEIEMTAKLMRSATRHGARFLSALCLCGALFALPACSGPTYSTGANVDAEYDFSQVNTYAFTPQRERSAHSENGERLASAIRAELTERGYEEVARDSAQVWISYDIGRYTPARLSGSNSFSPAEGGITVTVLDPATGRSIWYGWSQTILRKDTDAATAIPAAVAALFEGRLPSGAP